MSILSDSFIKRDRYGSIISPGDICVWGSKTGAVLCIYAGSTNGSKASGKFGIFYTLSGKKSISYRNIVAIRNPLGNNAAVKHAADAELLRIYYG